MNEPGCCCGVCGNSESTVVDTRHIAGATRRRRQCFGCGIRFTTYETVTGNARDQWQQVFQTFMPRIKAVFQELLMELTTKDEKDPSDNTVLPPTHKPKETP